MAHWQTAAIIGVGLIGGSIGLALRRSGAVEQVIGVGRDPAKLKKAWEVGAIDEFALESSPELPPADLVVVCTPIESVGSQIARWTETAAQGALITDAGSTKAKIVAAVDAQLLAHNPRQIRFVGSHPLAGSEKTGAENARENLFDKRTVVVTPTAQTDPSAVEQIQLLWEALGARVQLMTPQAHDAAVASTSHLPHLIASLLASITPPELLKLTAGGWLDTTRIAAGDVGLWQQILLDNREPVLTALSRFETDLALWHRALEQRDAVALEKLLQQGKTIRDAVGN
ncbi:prephenate dehydrogenase [Anatilimnocola aggregata]|uniref:Prephenate dehydrogenase n=1 Tax=Anatilimnocola aggregata TaxID=2528021 RepID=A0A517YA88_9BACT|nr:prephenate dehydrogenase/arogenate dehydrogenase family protein [Anatilimnocola aggregata]QDU27134.1 prephenate dehydrogenase [Anatilimnocola aggregata]